MFCNSSYCGQRFYICASFLDQCYFDMSCITGLRLDWTMPGGHGWWVDSIPSIELWRIIQCSIEWYYRCVYLKVLVIFVLMSFSATYPRQSTSLLQNFPMLNHVQTLHNIESSNTPSYESETSMYMSSMPSQNASSIFSSDSGPSYLPSDELSSSPPSRPVLQWSSDIDNEILVNGILGCVSIPIGSTQYVHHHKCLLKTKPCEIYYLILKVFIILRVMRYIWSCALHAFHLWEAERCPHYR